MLSTIIEYIFTYYYTGEKDFDYVKILKLNNLNKLCAVLS